MTLDVLTEVLSAISVQYNDQMPTNQTLLDWIKRCRIQDATAIATKVTKNPAVDKVMTIFKDASQEMTPGQVEETLLSFAEINYPQVIEMLNENEEDGQKVMDTLQIITEEICSGTS